MNKATVYAGLFYFIDVYIYCGKFWYLEQHYIDLKGIFIITSAPSVLLSLFINTP